ncbi:SMP-30/gluconolactonase/LRE family protein [uncultured Sphingomonas sp.]|uniref:SMP-30/gluconolactonase/LRE family protein n=1 Tax=uncultured Sphingomonas sp. TaxID=158754 RepID=UPI0035CBE767
MDCIADVRAILGEGPIWVARDAALYWVDIVGKKIFRWSATEGVRTWDVPIHVSTLAPRTGGGFVGAGHDGFLAVEIGAAITVLGDPEPDREGNRFNDGKVDREGRFWAGTMDRHERQASGALYRLDPNLASTRIDDGYRITNGPAFSVDGRTMYHTDSALQRVYAFDLAADGSVANRRVFAQFGKGDGHPDGMTVDADDCLWIAFWDGWCVRRLSPAGEPIAELKVPAQRPTSVAFGGLDLDHLFVTSARRGLTAAALASQPCAGGVFMAVPGVRGVAEPYFAG